MLNLFGICFLVMFTFTQAQVFREQRYIEVNPDQQVNITNPEYPGGYALKTAGQTIIRGPFYTYFTLKCVVALKPATGDCTDYNGVLIQLDGTTYLNTSNIYQICNEKQIYTFTSTSNTVVIGHYSTPDRTARSGAWFCNVQSVRRPCDCGRTRTTKIVGGTFSEPESNPSMVALLDKYNTLRGAGTIIGDKAILTAAHTISDGNGGVQDVRQLFAGVGRLNICRPFYEDTIYSENLQIVGYEMLPFNESNDTNDMAILYVNRFFGENAGVGPMCLPKQDQDPAELDYETAKIVGFGTVGFGMPYSCRMKEGNVVLRPRKRCKPYDSIYKICAQSIGNTPTDTCQGDSGGPLCYFDPRAARYRLIGVTQSGVYCGNVGFYESVSPRMRNFIVPRIRSFCNYN